MNCFFSKTHPSKDGSLPCLNEATQFWFWYDAGVALVIGYCEDHKASYPERRGFAQVSEEEAEDLFAVISVMDS